MAEDHFPEQDKLTLRFKDQELERAFTESYDKSVRKPLRDGIIISILSWLSALSLILMIIPEQMLTLGTTTVVFICSYFGFIVYATYKKRFTGYYHLMGAISNAWAGMYTIYFSDHFPKGEHLILPVLIFIIFFGSYMIRLRWIAGFLAALSYIVSYQIYILFSETLPMGEVILYSFVSWMVLIFAVLAGRTAESNYRIAYIQRKTINAQNKIIEHEKEVLLKEVHHRVQNNLQLIISLINLQMRKLEGSRHEDIECELCQIQGRVLSMSLVHQRMHQTSDFSKISLLEYTENLKNSIASQHRDKQVSVELAIDETVEFDIEQAIPLGLVLNEMIASTYLSVEGDVPRTVIIKGEVGERSTITYIDKGHAFPTDHANTLGFELMEVLAEQLSGEVTFSNVNGNAVYILIV